MIRSAALLQSERGVQGTALPLVISHSGAPRGSIYHHFPDGRRQLAGEATRWAADFITADLTEALETNDVLAALDHFTEMWLKVLQATDFRAGCPVAAGALDDETESLARREAGTGFADWERVLRDALVRSGFTRARAKDLALMIVASTEGAIVVARAQRSAKPYERVSAQLRAIIASELKQHAP